MSDDRLRLVDRRDDAPLSASEKLWAGALVLGAFAVLCAVAGFLTVWLAYLGGRL